MKDGEVVCAEGSPAVGPSLWDSDSAAFVVSFLFHLCLLVGLGLAPVLIKSSPDSLLITAPLEPLTDKQLTKLPEEFHFADQPADQVGAESVADSGIAISFAPLLSDSPEIPSPVEMTPAEHPILEMNPTVELARAEHLHESLAVRGSAGEGVTGAVGAIDRITQEILLSMEERKTLVVWLFDQSGSLLRQRQELADRLDHIYHELGVIEAAGNPAFKNRGDKPLLSSVVAFGQRVTLMTEKPTDDVASIEAAVRSITLDESGDEYTFTAIYKAADAYKHFRRPNAETKEPERNVLLVVFTDESGNDQQGLEQTVRLCRRYEMPVFIVGVPAPFGRKETLVKWVDPDPHYDQSPQWGVVDQGPESLLPECVRLRFIGEQESERPMDSGFGPYALTRLAYETGGAYFCVHPNRRVDREVRRGETAPFSAYLSRFFDPDRMRLYRPDYVSADEYARRARENKARGALLQASQLSWVDQMEDPRLRFIKRDEAQLAGELTEAQQAAAKLEPKLAQLYGILHVGEADRSRELSPRWQAGYDLAMGRVLAALVRVQGYNAMLASAKRGLKFKENKDNTWVLTPADEYSSGSQLAKAAERAKEYLQRVTHDHPQTPWAVLAQRELDTPLGWRWTETFTDLAPPRPRPNNAGAPRPAQNDRARQLPKPPPRRPPPKL